MVGLTPDGEDTRLILGRRHDDGAEVDRRGIVTMSNSQWLPGG